MSLQQYLVKQFDQPMAVRNQRLQHPFPPLPVPVRQRRKVTLDTTALRAGAADPMSMRELRMSKESMRELRMSKESMRELRMSKESMRGLRMSKESMRGLRMSKESIFNAPSSTVSAELLDASGMVLQQSPIMQRHRHIRLKERVARALGAWRKLGNRLWIRRVQQQFCNCEMMDNTLLGSHVGASPSLTMKGRRFGEPATIPPAASTSRVPSDVVQGRWKRAVGSSQRRRAFAKRPELLMRTVEHTWSNDAPEPVSRCSLRFDVTHRLLTRQAHLALRGIIDEPASRNEEARFKYHTRELSRARYSLDAPVESGAVAYPDPVWGIRPDKLDIERPIRPASANPLAASGLHFSASGPVMQQHLAFPRSRKGNSSSPIVHKLLADSHFALGLVSEQGSKSSDWRNYRRAHAHDTGFHKADFFDPLGVHSDDDDDDDDGDSDGGGGGNSFGAAQKTNSSGTKIAGADGNPGLSGGGGAVGGGRRSRDARHAGGGNIWVDNGDGCRNDGSGSAADHGNASGGDSDGRTGNNGNRCEGNERASDGSHRGGCGPAVGPSQS